MSLWSKIAAIIVAMPTTFSLASARSDFPTKSWHVDVPCACAGGVDILLRVPGRAD